MPFEKCAYHILGVGMLGSHLDMGHLVHESSKSLTARLLGRLKGNIEGYRAPAASFSFNSFAALSKCTCMRVLDLSLLYAAIPMDRLFKSLQTLASLEEIHFPHTHQEANLALDISKTMKWPPDLQAVYLSASNKFLSEHVMELPSSVRVLGFQGYPRNRKLMLTRILQNNGPQLQQLLLFYHIQGFTDGLLDDILNDCSNLQVLKSSVECFSENMFKHAPQNHPLQILELAVALWSDPKVHLRPIHISMAVMMGKLPDLRQVWIPQTLSWDPVLSETTDVADLILLLEQNEERRPLGIETGIWQSSGSRLSVRGSGLGPYM